MNIQIEKDTVVYHTLTLTSPEGPGIVGSNVWLCVDRLTCHTRDRCQVVIRFENTEPLRLVLEKGRTYHCSQLYLGAVVQMEFYLTHKDDRIVLRGTPALYKFIEPCREMVLGDHILRVTSTSQSASLTVRSCAPREIGYILGSVMVISGKQHE